MNNAVMKGLDIVKIVDKLVKRIEEQEKVKIEYTIERKAEDKTA